ncbi:Prevent-host-death family protein [Paragonimus heterotremus]|uniref:Prevent-host-death family protein n=1 Tax=Paragonimus heterotremus TaxID=100268 RepID=A0A8J4WGZ1_9TREM|nr:Prevent-host-death family protein [Paragonimus heterotremus]
MEGRVLSELKVADLRRELEKRQKDRSGVKQVLVDRLREALEEDGHDALSFRFGLEHDSHTECEIEQMSVNGDEVDVDKESYAKGAAPHDQVDARSESTNEEPKKLNEESVTYVVQVGEQEEDLDYDLKTDAVEEVEAPVDSQSRMDSSEKPDVLVNEGEKESGKANKTSSEGRRNLWVSNLPKTAKAADLKQHFSKAGKVVSATIVMSTRTPGGCFGFLQMGTAEDAANAALKFDGSDFNGFKMTVEATERKPPALASKLADRSGTSRVKPGTSKPEIKRPPPKLPSGRLATRRRPYGALRRAPVRPAFRRPTADEKRQAAIPPRLRPPRVNPSILAYQSLKRASRLLAASRYGMVRGLQAIERPMLRARMTRPPMTMIRPGMRFEAQPPVTRRYPLPDRRMERLPVRLEPSLRRPDSRPLQLGGRRPDPRIALGDRRRPMGSPHPDERPRLIIPNRSGIAPRRSEPTRHVESVRPREMPSVSPMDHRRMMQPSSAPRSFENLSRYERLGRPGSDSGRMFARPSDPARPRVEPRSADRAEVIRSARNLANGNRYGTSPHNLSFDQSPRYKTSYVGSPSPQRSGPPRATASKPFPMQSRRDYRDISRSPPRSRNVSLVRPYPEASPEHRVNRMLHDRSPLHNTGGGGLRPKVVDYGHRSEPRDSWSGWRNDGPSISTPSGHTWKPAGHSLVSNYGSRGSGRRY